MKNQERVWKAEQQKAEEDRKMAELQRELKEEREREVLKRTAEASGAIAKRGEEKLDWMYKGPGGHVSREEYLLGRKIDKALEQLERAEAAEEAQEGDPPPPQQSKSSYTIEHEINPESVIRREQSDIQVDMHRKLMEDPLLLIRKQEEETKRQITNNPVKMKQLQQLINTIKSKKNKRSRRSESTDSLSTSSDSESEDEKRGKRKKKMKKKLKQRQSLSSSSSSDDTESSSSSESDKGKKHKKKKKKSKSKKKKKEKSEQFGKCFSRDHRGEGKISH
ncbi:Pre-mRNA-splicing factor CWC25 [Portunus trituberculatus]|uniref:Pre-mRNA-splicing factor CWC25 n=1 Tax=Portunus trituberculatus TaxID=210409 RepID=A0A5B7GMT5_PORTR|nr:Pre-mRNA-splicing factor CWC25 [Portunus trituberculatus]